MAGGKLVGALKLMGPAFLVSVAYLDPGNWATAVEAGSRFGYQLIWVVVLSNLIAILLQTLAARLGIVTGKHLAEVCREQYPVVVCFFLWVLCEISIVALDLTMVLGTAVGLNMLFRLPLLPCIFLTSLDALMVLFMLPGTRLQWSEMLTVGIVGLVLMCFLVDVVFSAPPLGSVIKGLWPKLERDSIYTAVSLLGANVMPHNFYLHSALVKGRQNEGQTVGAMCHYNFIDVTCALGVALLINLAVLIVSASTFFSAGIVVETLQDAHDLMEQLLSSSIAPAVFGLALLFAGQLSTFTGTIAGQVVLKGFLNIEISPWLRRLLTRSAAIIPAAILQQVHGDQGTYKMLVIAQVILALQLPFTLVPLIKATSERKLMGRFANSGMVQIFAWGSTLLIFMASLMLFVNMLLPAEALDSSVGIDGDFGVRIRRWLTETSDLAWHAPFRLALLVLLVIMASSSLALLLWMLITPFSHGSTDHALMPFFSKEFEFESSEADLKREKMMAWYRQGSIQVKEHHTANSKQGHRIKLLAGERGEWQVSVRSVECKESFCPEVGTKHAVPEANCQVPPPNAIGRGVRRQISSTLDKFWANHYDLHGGPLDGHAANEDSIPSISACMEAVAALDSAHTFAEPHDTPPWQLIDDTLVRRLHASYVPFDGASDSVDQSPLYLFGMWCLVRMLELCEAEARPELWGRYCSVLNRLQWLLPHLKRKEPVVSENVLAMLGRIEVWVKERKGPKGTVAGDVAFPKGKEIALSVVKRYRRQLGATRGSHQKRALQTSIGIGLSGGVFFLGLLGWAGLSPPESGTNHHDLFLQVQ